MVNLFDIGGLLSKKNLSAWLSLLLLFHLPLFFEIYIVLKKWPQFWGLYLIVMVLMMVFGTMLSFHLLYRRLNEARKAYSGKVLTRLLGTYLLPLAILGPGIVSFLLGLLIAIPAITDKAGNLLSRVLAITPQQWYNSILLVHTREQGSAEMHKHSQRAVH